MDEPFEFEVPDDVYAWLEEQAKAEGVSVDEFATKVILKFLEELEEGESNESVGS